MAPRKKQETIEKKEKPDSSTSRLRLGEIGTPYLSTTGQEIQKLQKTELKWPRSLKTYDRMRYDDTVDQGLTLVELFLIKSFYKAKVKPGNPKSQKSVDFAEFCNWCLRNQSGINWYETITNISTYAQYGHAVIQKSYEGNTSGRFSQYKYKIKSLLPIPQHSISKFDLINTNKFITQYPSSITQFYTDLSLVNNLSGAEFSRSKVMMFSWDSKNMNPLGRSPLESCFKSYQEKNWIEDYQVVGICHDMTGVLVIRVPMEILDRAAADPSGDDAKSISKTQMDAASVQGGDQTYLILSSDVNDSGKYQYDVELMATSGGKQFDLTEVIDQRKKAILNVFGAGVTVMGQDGSGSYALSQTGESLHAHHQSRHQMFVCSVFENDLFPQLAAINGIELTEEEMPVLVPAEIDQVSMDELSKMVQRVKSVNGLVMSKENIIQYHEMLGFDVNHMLDMSEEELHRLMQAAGTGTSRAGESQGSSGTGNSQQGGIASTTNSNNAA